LRRSPLDLNLFSFFLFSHQQQDSAQNAPFTCLTCASCASGRDSLDEACSDKGKKVGKNKRKKANHHHRDERKKLTKSKSKTLSSFQRTPSGSTPSAASSSAARAATTSTTATSTPVPWELRRLPGTCGAARGRDLLPRSRRRHCGRATKETATRRKKTRKSRRV